MGRSAEIPRSAAPALARQRPLAVALTGAACAWTVLLLAAPLAFTTAGTPRLGAAVVYAAGALVCHQRPERSFHLHDVQMPVCARCAALYLSGAVGMLAGWLGCARGPRHAPRLLVACALPMALSLVTEWTGLVAGSPPTRAVSALPAGGVAGWLLVRMLRSEARRMRYDSVV